MIDGIRVDARDQIEPDLPRFLRTLTWHDYDDINDAAQELFVRDLRDEPRGLSGFSALTLPVSRPPK